MEAAEKLMEDMGWLMVHSLTSVQNDLLLTTYYLPLTTTHYLLLTIDAGALAQGRPERDDTRQALLRMLRLRYHDRQ